MPFTDNNCIPGNVNPRFVESYSIGVRNGVVLLVTPTRFDNTPFSLASLTGATIYLDNNQVPGSPQYLSKTLTGTIVTATSTNATISLASADISTALPSLVQGNITSGKITVQGTDGTNEVVIATGQWSLLMSA